MESWLNFFRRTRLEYFADFFITPPITLALLIVSLAHASLWWPLQFGAGALAWTLYEYATHRWVLHRVWPFREMHELHHKCQRDYIAVHPAATVALYVVVAAIFGLGSSAITVGFSTAYIVYSCMHTAFHYATIDKENWLYALKLNHVAHHRNNGCYGVTSPWWDVAFGTYRQSK